MTIPIATRTRSSESTAGPPRRRNLPSAALVVAAVLTAALPGASHAQPQTLDEPPAATRIDQRWLPWLGCWRLVEEAGALPDAAGDFSAFADSVMVCVTPAAPPAAATDVVVTTLVDGEQVLVETLSADGVEHPVDQSECRGRRRIAWSDDGARLFTRAELTCSAGDDARRLSAVGLMADDRTWLALELVATGERAAVTVKRYRRTGDVTTLSAAGPTLTPDLLARARSAANRVDAADLTIDDVIEAGTAVEPPVLEALLVETDTSLDLDGRTLIRLDDGGVPEDIIDMLVALSFPDDFSVQRSRPTASYGGGGGGFLGSWGGYGYDTWYPYYAAPFGYYYGWSPYRSLYGWGDYYYVDPGYYGLPGSLITDAPDVSEGRVYGGYGYTRAGGPQDGGGRRAQPRGVGVAGGSESSGGSAARAPRSTGASSGSRGVSARGWSSGGSSSRGGGGSSSSGGSSRGASSSGGGSSSGRTATPRDP